MKARFLLRALLLLSTPAALRAGTLVTAAPDKEVVRAPCAQLPLGSLTLGSQFSAHGTGGYLDALTGLWASPGQAMALLLDSRFRLEDSSENISSTGLVFRRRLPGREVIFGANFYYDSIDSENDHHFDQLGLGAEVLTRYVDWRFNYYLPESGSKTFGTTRTAAGRFERFESGLEGLNTELGFLFPGVDRYLEVRLFGGFYHYNNPFGHDYQGFKGRLEARLLPGVIADLEYWQDARLMEGHWTAGVRVSVPFSLWSLARGRNPFEGAGEAFRPRGRPFAERMGEMVMRSPRVQTASSGPRQVSFRHSVAAAKPESPPQQELPFPVE